MTVQIDRYRLIKCLARGGMAEIWLAQQRAAGGFEKLVAVKRILPGLAERSDFVRMFLDEARLAAQLSHPNIVQIFDLGQAGSTYYIAMEFIHGENLRLVTRRAAEHGGVPIALAVKIASETAAALHYAHHKANLQGEALGIVHRDISPQNLLVSYEGQVKVVDFGIAKATGSLTETRTGVIKGKYPYMSPEQVMARKIDGRSDLYSLGIVLWELLTGRRLYDQPTDFLVMDAIVKGEPPKASLYRKEVPASLDALLAKLLARRPEDRFANGHKAHQALEAYLREDNELVSAVELEAWLRGLFPDRLSTWSKLVAQREQQSIEPDVLEELSGFMGMTPSSELGTGSIPVEQPETRSLRNSKPKSLSGAVSQPIPRTPAAPGIHAAAQAGPPAARPASTGSGLRPAAMPEAAPDLGNDEENQLDDEALSYGRPLSSASLAAAAHSGGTGAGTGRPPTGARRALDRSSNSIRPPPASPKRRLSHPAPEPHAPSDKDRDWDDEDREADDRPEPKPTTTSNASSKGQSSSWAREALRDRIDRWFQPARSGLGRLLQFALGGVTVVGMIWLGQALARGAGLNEQELALANRVATGLAEQAGIITPGIILVRSYPGGARVRMDGRTVGLTPMSLKIGKRSAPARIDLHLEGYHPWSKVVRDPGKGVRLEVQLTPITGALH